MSLLSSGNEENSLQFAVINHSVEHVDIFNLEIVNEDIKLVSVDSVVLDIMRPVSEGTCANSGLPVHPASVENLQK